MFDEAANLVVYSGRYWDVPLCPRLVQDCQYVDRRKEVLAEVPALLVGPRKGTVVKGFTPLYLTWAALVGDGLVPTSLWIPPEV